MNGWRWTQGTYSAVPIPSARRSAITASRSTPGASLTMYTNQERLWSGSSAHSAQLVELRGIAEHVDSDDGFRPGGDRRLEGGRIQVERQRIDVREDRGRALEDEAVGRGDERNRRGDRLVSGTETRDVTQKMESRGAARDRGGEGRANLLRHQLFEAVDRRPEREPS